MKLFQVTSASRSDWLVGIVWRRIRLPRKSPNKKNEHKHNHQKFQVPEMRNPTPKTVSKKSPFSIHGKIRNPGSFDHPNNFISVLVDSQLGFVLLVIFHGFYHGKSPPRNHHLGEYMSLCFPSIFFKQIYARVSPKSTLTFWLTKIDMAPYHGWFIALQVVQFLQAMSLL